jgi:2-polyprenyl-3-methyl-5-hydroxy-6-metoxy-1,4-benzoquinol methylase
MEIESRRHIQEDFDRLAVYPEAAWNHNTHYHEYLLQHIPQQCQHILEIGCGKGTLTRRLANRAARITAIDLSPIMLQYAQESSAGSHNIAYVCADFVDVPTFPEYYDCIVTVATLHHLPVEYSIRKMRAALKPHGTLAILDLFQGEGFVDVLRSLLATCVHRYLSLTRNTGYQTSSEEQRVWAQHGAQETYPTMSSLHNMCHTLLPGAILQKHLLWRYSLFWHKRNC